MLKWIENTINGLGYFGIVLLMALENVFPPIPSELIMPLAGFTAARGELSFVGVVVAGMAGSVLGAIPLYFLGRWAGAQRLHSWVERNGKWLLLSPGDLKRVDAWFDRYGRVAVLLCRLVPGIRSLISIPAGFSGMNFGLFLLYTAIGTGVWAMLLAYAGKLLRENYEQVSTYLGPAAYVVLAILVGWLVVRAVRMKKQAGERKEG
jgi:membrane protein DedA with SNARE-associated domain